MMAFMRGKPKTVRVAIYGMAASAAALVFVIYFAWRVLS